MPGKTLYCLGEAWLELKSTAPLASAETFSPRMGGSAAALALAYAALGGRASLLTQLGEDVFGHRIADALSTAGVDISRVCFTSRAPTPLLFDGGGEQLGCRTRSSELLYAPEQLGADWAADAEMLAFSSACLVDSPCRYTHLAALDTARTAGVPVCFVPSLRPALWPGEKTLRDTVMQFLPFADILLLTADEMELYLDESTLADAAIHFALLSYAAGVASNRYVSLLRQQQEAEGAETENRRKDRRKEKEKDEHA